MLENIEGYRFLKLCLLSVKRFRIYIESRCYTISLRFKILQHVLWPFLLKLIIPRKYTGAIAVVETPQQFKLHIILSFYDYHISYLLILIVRSANAYQNCAGVDHHRPIQRS